jgi:hypothetical protein
MRLIVLFFTLFSLSSCVGRYHQPPSKTSPHAELFFDFTKTFRKGGRPANSLTIDNKIQLVKTSSVTGRGASRTRVEPGYRKFLFNSYFVSSAKRMVSERYYVYRSVRETRRESYSCGTSYSGYGSSRSSYSRTCYRTRTRYVSKRTPKYRTVYRTYYYNHHQCRGKVSAILQDSNKYLFHFIHKGAGICEITCSIMRRTSSGDAFFPCKDFKQIPVTP